MNILVYADIKGYQNEMAELVRAFFPGHIVKLVETMLDDFSSNCMICCQHKVVENKLEITITIHNNDKKLKHTVECNLEYKDELEYRKIVKNNMKLALYDALEKFTGTSLDWGALTGIRPTKIVHDLIDKGLDREKILDILHEKYRVNAQKSNLLIEIAKAQRPYLIDNSEQKVAVYINIPICTTKCLYCSFPSDTIDRCGFLIDDYITALKSELKQFSIWMKENGIKVETVYIGGGTPTALGISQLDRLLQSVRELIIHQNSGLKIEYTVEGGRPDSMNREKLSLLKKHGVNRISINPQSMNQKTLSAIGRSHTPEEAIHCFYMAREIGFECINMDVIVGLPGEDQNDVGYTIEQIRKLKPDNLTVHTLSVKRASRLRDRVDEYSFPDTQTAAEMLEICRRGAMDMGMIPYYLYRQKYMLGNMENIGYAVPGKECIYNIQIMEERQSVWAFGAGGITKIYYPEHNRIERIANVKNIKEYIDRIDEMIERKQKARREQ